MRYLLALHGNTLPARSGLPAQPPVEDSTRVRSGRAGVGVGYGLMNAKLWSNDNVGDAGGTGPAFRLSYGFSPRFALFAGGGAALISAHPEGSRLSQVDLGVRVVVGSPTARIAPCSIKAHTRGLQKSATTSGCAVSPPSTSESRQGLAGSDLRPHC